MQESPKISVIIPVYNVEKYLRECLDSIAVQTFAEWECILVDDGSKDGSGAICDEYELKDSRFKVIHKQNAGVSSARNTGLDNANAEWVVFIDSDDWIDNNYLELLYSTAVKTDSDMVVCGYIKQNRKESDNSSDFTEENFPCNTNGKDFVIQNRNEFLEEFPKMRIDESDVAMLHTPWMRLYRRTKDLSARFDSGIKWGEDYLFNLEYFSKLNRISFVADCLYHYRYTEGSITNTVENKFVDDAFVYINATKDFFEKYLPKNKTGYFYCYKRMEFRRLLNNVVKKCVFAKNNLPVLDYLIKVIRKESSLKEIFAKPFKLKDSLALLSVKLGLVKMFYLPIAKLWLYIKKKS